MNFSWDAMTLHDLNGAREELAREALLACCGSEAWVMRMAANRPFADTETFEAQAEDVWWQLTDRDWLDAFAKHPKIGQKRDNAKWSAAEQAGMTAAGRDASDLMYRRNVEYENRFGFIFIVCATEKTAEEMLSLIDQRMGNEPAAEMRIAAQEQAKITRLRLRKLLAE
jgi:2-oxo-4-hydroxy-4-carboxy-5-ureidoimidazoline decarboxylase